LKCICHPHSDEIQHDSEVLDILLRLIVPGDRVAVQQEKDWLVVWKSIVEPDKPISESCNWNPAIFEVCSQVVGYISQLTLFATRRFPEAIQIMRNFFRDAATEQSALHQFLSLPVIRIATASDQSNKLTLSRHVLNQIQQSL
jgi:hypothetical protein